MLSISKSICPECEYEMAILEINPTRLEVLFCPRCGYETRSDYSRNKVTINKAFGACRMQFSKGHARVGSVVEPITTEIIDEFQRIIADGEILEEGSYLTRWDSQNKFGEILIGSTKYISFL